MLRAILIVSSLDTKGQEVEFLKELIEQKGQKTILLDISTRGESPIAAGIPCIDVAREGGAVFVDGYRAVPHDLDHLRDHVHLHDAGSEILAAEIARVLTHDAQFMRLVDRVRAEDGTDSD